MARMSNTRQDIGPQRYERSPASFAGTSRSIETRVTSGHSDTSGQSPSLRAEEANGLECLPSNTTADGTDSASIYDRELPPPPPSVVAGRPFFSATQDAEDLVAAYSASRDSGASERSRGDDPYDGLADDEETTDSHQNSAIADRSASSASRELPTPPVDGLDIARPDSRLHESRIPVRKPLRSVSHDSSDAKRASKPLPSP